MSKPEAGQWWFSNDGSERCYIHGISSQGTPIYELDQRYVATSRMWEGWHHEPRCTGWDWVVPDQPAEDPDEWVIQDRVPVRTSCDQVMWIKDGKSVTGFAYSFRNSASDGKMHGYTESSGYQLHVRCRRRDLPKVEPQQCAACDAPAEPGTAGCKDCNEYSTAICSPYPQPQKTRVRLWKNAYGSVMSNPDCENIEGWQEIHHDSEGFYTID